MNDKEQFDLRLERYLLGELPISEMKSVDDELRHNAELRDKLEALRRNTENYFQKYPRMRSQAVIHAPQPEPWWRVFFAPRVIGGLAFAVAVIALLFFLPKPVPVPVPVNNTITSDKKNDNVIIAMKQDTDENTARTKGNRPALFLSVVRNTQKIGLAEGNAVHPGEEIQIAYRASGHRYGVIVSVDNAHAVTLHFPETERTPQNLKGGNQVALPLAFKLDEKPGFEKFYFLASDKPLPLRQVMQELAKSGNINKTIGPPVQRMILQLKKE